MGACIRPVAKADAQQIAEIYAHFVRHTPVSFESEAPDAAEMAKRIEEIGDEYPWLVCESDGLVAGYAYSSRHRPRLHYQWSVDVSVYVHEGFRRRGVGRALYTSLLAMLPQQGFVVVHAGITLPNEGSVGLHEALGFKPIGVYKNVGYKLGSWHDVGWWQLPLSTPPSDPAPPLRLEDVKNTDIWKQALASGESLLSL